jgi:hypothetical protein
MNIIFAVSVSASILLFYTIFQCVGKLSENMPVFMKLHFSEKSRWCFWWTCLIQNLITFPLAIWCLMYNNYLIWNVSIALVLGHAFIDFWWWYAMYRDYEETPDWSLFVHHVMIVWVGGTIPILYNQEYEYSYYYIIVQILHEGSSPFISVSMILYLSGFDKRSLPFKVNSVILLTSFIFCHDAVNAYTWYHVSTSSYLSELTWFCIFVLQSGIAVITLLSVFWTYAFATRTMKLFKSGD